MGLSDSLESQIPTSIYSKKMIKLQVDYFTLRYASASTRASLRNSEKSQNCNFRLCEKSTLCPRMLQLVPPVIRQVDQ